MRTIRFLFLLGVVIAAPACSPHAGTVRAAAGPTSSSPDIDPASLATLGRVWGFLKYFHPTVAAGTIDWDSVGAAAITHALAARTPADHARVLHALVDAAGAVPACGTCEDPPADAHWHNHDDAWLHDGTLPDDGIRQRLLHVRANRHTGSGRWVTFPTSTQSLAADTAFMRPAYPAAAQRLLGLFRYWNAVRYWFAYLYVNDGDWNDVLAGFIPRMIGARDAVAYHLAVLELTTRVRDTHVTTTSPVLDSLFGEFVPPFEARSVEGHIVVSATPEQPGGGGPMIGDIITHVNGTPVVELRERHARYVAAGNAVTFERNLVRLVLRTRRDTATYTIERGESVLQARVAMVPLPPPPASVPLTPPFRPVAELVRVLPGDVAYIDLGGVERTQVDSIMALLRDVSGLVLDVRQRPRGTMFDFAAHLNAEPTPFVLFTLPDSTFPGVFRYFGPLAAGPQEAGADHFRGRVAILVDERTQSHGEFTAMALQTAPRSRVFGSQTAGADGNVVAVFLPGGIRTLFTGVGVYYPDGRQTQRIGIIPDVEVLPTVAGVRAGRDEVLERALEYIRTGS